MYPARWPLVTYLVQEVFIMAGFTRLQEEVIGTGLCTDCGTCVAVCPNKAISMNYGTEEPELTGKCAPKCQLCYDTCPGKDINLPELNRVAFGRGPNDEEALLGVAQTFLRAYAVDSEVRDAGAAGGVVSALLIYALEKGIIDAAVVTGMSTRQPWRVKPRLATSREEVIASAQSRYAAVPVNSIIGEALAAGRRQLGVVGLPCHVHGLRKVQALGRPKQVDNALKFTIGILCGSCSHYRGTEHMIEEICGVPLAQVAKVEFRGGEYPGRFQVTTKEGQLVLPSSSAMGNAVSFYRDRCLMCYDYPAEVADISVGDYFHPDMRRGVKGWSVIIVRSDRGKELVDAARADGYLNTEPVDSVHLLGAGWEQKRHGAPYRILERQRHGWPTPDYHLPLDYPRPLYRSVQMAPPYAEEADKT